MTARSGAGSAWVKGTVWIAVLATWVIGFISNYLIAPTNTGLDVVSSYASFQSGSHVGNLIALTLWTAASLWAGWRSARSEGLIEVRLLTSFGVTATSSLYPSLVISHAVGHVVPIEDGFQYDDWLAVPLIVAGVVSLFAAGVLAVIHGHRTVTGS